MAELTSQIWPSFDRFRNTVASTLRETEAANNLMLGLMASRADAAFPVLATVHRHETLCLAALQTDTFTNLVLSFSPHLDAASHLAQALRKRQLSLPGVVGEVQLARRFAEEWAQYAHTAAEVTVKERIYAIETVTPGRKPDGALRWANQDDRTWLCEWVKAFSQEATPHVNVNRVAEIVNKKLEGFPQSGYLILEDDHKPLSIAGFGGPTGTGIRVGPVYTPPNLRAHGYASDVVRALTARLFSWGYASLFLFTDLNNPTSNRIYQKIGYHPITDVDEYRFS